MVLSLTIKVGVEIGVGIGVRVEVGVRVGVMVNTQSFAVFNYLLLCGPEYKFY